MVRYDKSTAAKGARYVEDRRGSGGGRRRSGGRTAIGGAGGLGITGVIFLLLFQMCSGGSSGLALEGDGSGFGESIGAVDASGTEVVAESDDTLEFMQFLMFDVQDTWDEYFDQAGLNYQETNLIVFEDSVSTGCGNATSAVGPFYCPAPGDNNVYIDFVFYEQLSRDFGAPGDFAQAYVIAHEVGHHIQSIAGISDEVRAAQQRQPELKNEYSIRQELQADCFAGVWAFSASQRLTRDSGLPIIEAGDIEEGLAAAASVGDDRIQQQAGMQVDPHTWTHGSSQQRIDWFRIGFDNGDPELCDPFAVDQP